MPESDHMAVMERRRHPRTRLNMSVRCIRLDPDCGDVVDHLHVMDVSRSGMGAVADRAFYPGQRVIVCLPMTDSSGRRDISATIVRCKHRGEGFHVGLEFEAAALGSTCEAVEAIAA